MWFFVYFFIPETKGVALERMDELFGAVSAHSDDKLTGSENGDKGHSTRVEVSSQRGESSV